MAANHKTIQLSHREGANDSARKGRQAQKFLDSGKQVTVLFRIKVRADRVTDTMLEDAKDSMNAFLDTLEAQRGKIAWTKRDGRVTLNPRKD